MGAYFIRRIFIAIPVLIGLTVLSFFIISLTPGDPLLARLNPEALAQVASNPEMLAEARARFGLDGPIYMQYLNWLGNVIQGDLGYSVSTRRPIIDEIGPRIWPSLSLMMAASLFAVAFGIPAGVIAAVKQYGKADYVLSGIVIVLISTPGFVVGLLAIYLFGVQLDWLPVGELYTFGKEDDIIDRISHLILPALVLGSVGAAMIMRYTRASMLDALGSDYITTAKAKGLASRVVIVRHGLRNALIPIITVLAFLMPELIAGAVITETVFNWPGLGQLSVIAANAGDPSLMMGIILIVGIAVIVASIIADFGYSVADPRIRYTKDA